jgi:uncharacterized membrane protein YhfC
MTPVPAAPAINLMVVAVFVITILLEILIPLLAGYLITKRFGVPWNLFLTGAGFFIVIQILHIPLVLLTQGPLLLLLKGWVADPTILLALVAVYLGLMAGIFEEIGRYLAFTWYFSGISLKVSRENGLMFGAGWGGVECVLVAFMVAGALVSYLTVFFVPGSVAGAASDPVAIKALEALYALTPVDILYGLLERILALTLQITWSLMVMYAVMRKTPLFLGLAIIWHAGVDFLAVFITGVWGIPASEGLLIPFALAGLAFILWVWPRIFGIPESGQG